MEEKDVKVRLFKCLCGKARYLAVIDPDRPFSKESKKTQRELMYAGCEVVTISLNEAREADMCFTCKL